jgi:hypothetical protein
MKNNKKQVREFNLMVSMDKKMKVNSEEPNGLSGKSIVVLDGYANDIGEIIIKTKCGKEVNSKYLTMA